MRCAGRGLACALATLLGVLVAAVVAEPAAAAPDPPFGLVPQDAPDPDALTAEGRHWLYSTNVFPYGVTVNVPVRVSDDLLTWHYAGDALPALGAWARPGKTWAPSVTAVGSAYVLHYVATERSSWRQCIGVAVAASPVGPFVDNRGAPLVCDVDLGGSIDPDTFVAPGGQLILHWKSDGNAIGARTAIWGRELDGTGTSFAAGSTPRLLMHSDAGAPWEGGIIENPAMVTGADGSTWLLYSGGFWESDGYAIGAAHCAGPLGPCTRSGTLLASSGGAVGPGGASVFVDRAGGLRVALHAWSGPPSYRAGGERWAAVAPLQVDGGGPRLRPDLSGRVQESAAVRVTRCGAFSEADAARSITRLYRAYFGRGPDDGGAAYWLAAHLGGAVCLTDISEYFASSQEFVATYGPLGTADFVRLVYLNVLGREPDAGGYAYWTQHLAAGLRRGTFMVGFSESPEFRARTTG